MKKYLICLMCLLFISNSTHSQVTIGRSEKPVAGALLQLKNLDDPTGIGANATKGMILPRVSLKGPNNLEPCLTTAGNLDPIERKNHTGLMVYNTRQSAADGVCTGLYVWAGELWNRIPEPCIHVVFASNSGQTLTGAAVKPTLYLSPEDAVVTWSSSDNAVATVDNTGIITTHSPGNATITASIIYGGHSLSDTYSLEVANLSVALNKTSKNIIRRMIEPTLGSYQLTTGTISPAWAVADLSDITYQWASSATDIATVTNAGLVGAVDKGGAAQITATITAKYRNENIIGSAAVCNITVIDAGPTQITDARDGEKYWTSFFGTVSLNPTDDTPIWDGDWWTTEYHRGKNVSLCNASGTWDEVEIPQISRLTWHYPTSVDDPATGEREDVYGSLSDMQDYTTSNGKIGLKYSMKDGNRGSQDFCPDGWRLPNQPEFLILELNIRRAPHLYADNLAGAGPYNVGEILLSKNAPPRSTLPVIGGKSKAADKGGFDAIPIGGSSYRGGGTWDYGAAVMIRTSSGYPLSDHASFIGVSPLEWKPNIRPRSVDNLSIRCTKGEKRVGEATLN